jgi:Uma2 family endonuclease
MPRVPDESRLLSANCASLSLIAIGGPGHYGQHQYNVIEASMPGDFLQRRPQLTMKQFHAFRDERPKEEKWELIDGVPMVMPPPTVVHIRIARNLEALINARLEGVKPEWQADREVGVWLKDDEKYNPEPDVTVIDTAVALGQIYVQRFYFVAEVLSESDKKGGA